MTTKLGSPDPTTTSETEASSLSGGGAVANRIAEIRAQIEVLAAKAESGEQWAEICRLECEAVKLERGIRTENLNPPISLRRYDWVAYFDGQEESGPKGFGSTEQQAITELLDDCPGCAPGNTGCPEHDWAEPAKSNLYDAAKDLHDFLGKFARAPDDDREGIEIKGDDIFAEGLTDRLNRLREALACHADGGTCGVGGYCDDCYACPPPPH